ncbi:hypothetical protein Pelo_2581 [Pelomyxa schiedti]|nr:hypothetical protein Pelo_2581 [Pelomyxa schiedti]
MRSKKCCSELDECARQKNWAVTSTFITGFILSTALFLWMSVPHIIEANTLVKEKCMVYNAQVASQYITSRCDGHSDSGCCAYQCSCAVGTITGSQIQAQEIIISRPVVSVDYPECGIPEELCGPSGCSSPLAGLEVDDTWDCWVSTDDLIYMNNGKPSGLWFLMAAGIMMGVGLLLVVGCSIYTLIVTFMPKKYLPRPIPEAEL